MESDSANSQVRNAEVVPVVSRPRCSLCGTDRVRRMERVGLREKWIYSLFGFYPWRCSMCGGKIYLRARYRRSDKRKRYVD